MEYDIGIGYGDDLEQARHIILEVLRATDGVDPDPKADVILVAFDESSVRLVPGARAAAVPHAAQELSGQDGARGGQGGESARSAGGTVRKA